MSNFTQCVAWTTYCSLALPDTTTDDATSSSANEGFREEDRIQLSECHTIVGRLLLLSLLSARYGRRAMKHRLCHADTIWRLPCAFRHNRRPRCLLTSKICESVSTTVAVRKYDIMHLYVIHVTNHKQWCRANDPWMQAAHTEQDVVTECKALSCSFVLQMLWLNHMIYGTGNESPFQKEVVCLLQSTPDLETAKRRIYRWYERSKERMRTVRDELARSGINTDLHNANATPQNHSPPR